MNIILVTHQFFPNYSAGTEVLTLQMAKGLICLGHKTLVITGNINKTKTTTKKYVFEGVDVVQLNVKPTSLCNKIKAHTNKPYLKKPFKKTIKEFAPVGRMPYEGGNSWIEMIERGMSNFSSYMHKKTTASRSGAGIQVKGRIRSAKSKPTQYMTELLEKFKKELRTK